VSVGVIFQKLKRACIQEPDPRLAMAEVLTAQAPKKERFRRKEIHASPHSTSVESEVYSRLLGEVKIGLPMLKTPEIQ